MFIAYLKVTSLVCISRPNTLNLHQGPSHIQTLPEFKEYCGVSLCILNSMCSLTLGGKYWYQAIQEYLLNNEFIQSATVACLFNKKFPVGANLFLLHYTDYILYYGTTQHAKDNFTEHLVNCCDLELISYIILKYDHNFKYYASSCHNILTYFLRLAF